MVVNKLRPLVPLDYSPPDLVQWRGITIRDSIRADAEAMFVAAASQGVTLLAVSGFRTYAYQVSLFEGYQQTSGPEQTLIRSARPGYSEHQTGFAFDVAGDQGCVLSACFAETNAARWVEAHAFEFGFCVRYGLEQGAITGYDYEPWHLRYVGREVAAEMVARKIYTLEQFYGLPAAPNYA
ncbi:M15 family metallopeptidase [Micrococcales bacterium 31B]|nr:M15 family metallopeptidase [Micrococcales bacterium 31B]